MPAAILANTRDSADRLPPYDMLCAMRPNPSLAGTDFPILG
ncbi:hypothetical protein [Mycobacterium decipiens]|nr:hypothetical protein [Mycobacterium decipiens]